MFSFRIFIVSGLVFKSNSFLADFFVQYRIAVQFHFFFFFLACDYLVYPTLFIEKTIFSPLYFWHLCKKNNWPYMQRFICELSISSISVSTWCMWHLCHCHAVDYCSFVIQLEIRRYDTFSFVLLFFSWLFWLFRVFCGSYANFRFVLFLWKMPLKFWEGLYWIYSLIWVVWIFQQY